MGAYGVSGNEEHVRDIIKKEIMPYVDKTYVDKAGNLVCIRKGKPPKVMLAAHMDEIGLMVKNVDERGHIFFSNVGQIEPISLLGQMVKIHTEKGQLYGVITMKKVSNGESVNEIPAMKDMYIDTGLNGKQLTAKGLEIGDYLNIIQEMQCLGSNKIICGKGLDDRIGCYTLIELAKKLKKTKNELYFVFTVQEEMGLYGAKTSAYEISPDWAIAIDVMPASDSDGEPSVGPGRGPILTMKDAGMISSKPLNKHIVSVSKSKKIPLQFDVTEFGTTDALNISLSRSGVPVTAMGVSVRNIHSAIGIANADDINNLIKLLEALLKNPPVIK